MWAAIQHMGIEHGGLDILVAQQFLNRPDVIAVSQQTRGKGVPEGVTGGVLDQSGLADSLFDRALHGGFVNMMAPLFARPWIHPPVVGGEDERPAPLGGGIGIRPRQGMRQDNPPPSLFLNATCACAISACIRQGR